MRRISFLLLSLLTIIVTALVISGWVWFITMPIPQQGAISDQIVKVSFPLGALSTVTMLIAAFIFWLWALIHLLKNQQVQGTNRIVWALIIILCHFLGAILYFLLWRSTTQARSLT